MRAACLPALLAIAAIAALVACARFVVACDVGQGPETGIGEPMQVAGGQFVPGALPGTPPILSDAGAVPARADAGPAPLSVLSFTYASTQIVPGIAGKSIGGDVTNDAVAVGVRLAGLGTGYWVSPVGALDLQVPNAYTFGLSTSFDPNDPPGLRNLEFVAIGPSGAAGTQNDLQVCLDSRIPDNGHACDPTVAPPAAVFTLQWDTNFDLDLHVVDPSGVDFNPKMPLGEPLDAAILRTIPKDAPYIDRDSLRGCVPDGLRQEDLVYPDLPPKGTYHVYVDPFQACGQATVHFTFTLYQSSGTCPACNLHAVSSESGELLASQVTGGTAPPLFIQDILVP